MCDLVEWMVVSSRAVCKTKGKNSDEVFDQDSEIHRYKMWTWGSDVFCASITDLTMSCLQAWMTNHAGDLDEDNGPKKKSKHQHRKVIDAILPLGQDLSLLCCCDLPSSDCGQGTLRLLWGSCKARNRPQQSSDTFLGGRASPRFLLFEILVFVGKNPADTPTVHATEYSLGPGFWLRRHYRNSAELGIEQPKRTSPSPPSPPPPPPQEGRQEGAQAQPQTPPSPSPFVEQKGKELVACAITQKGATDRRHFRRAPESERRKHAPHWACILLLSCVIKLVEPEKRRQKVSRDISNVGANEPAIRWSIDAARVWGKDPRFELWSLGQQGASSPLNLGLYDLL